MTTPPHTPPMAASNEAEPDQLEVARAEGDAYARALEAMDEESGAVTQRAGDYLVAFVQENAEGMYELEDGRLVWREAPEETNAHLEIAGQLGLSRSTVAQMILAAKSPAKP